MPICDLCKTCKVLFLSALGTISLLPLNNRPSMKDISSLKVKYDLNCSTQSCWALG